MESIFRQLSEEEEKKYRDWAWSNYVPLHPIKGIWHPVVQEECVKMNRSFITKDPKETEKFKAIEKKLEESRK